MSFQVVLKLKDQIFLVALICQSLPLLNYHRFTELITIRCSCNDIKSINSPCLAPSGSKKEDIIEILDTYLSGIERTECPTANRDETKAEPKLKTPSLYVA